MSDVLMCIYRRATGRLEQYIECPDWMVDSQVGGPDFDYLLVTERYPGATHMVNVAKRQIAVRPILKFSKTQIKADGKDAARLTVGVPFSAEIDDAVYPVNDGILEIVSSMPAVYRVVVRHFPYQDLDQEITST